MVNGNSYIDDFEFVSIILHLSYLHKQLWINLPFYFFVLTAKKLFLLFVLSKYKVVNAFHRIHSISLAFCLGTFMMLPMLDVEFKFWYFELVYQWKNSISSTHLLFIHRCPSLTCRCYLHVNSVSFNHLILRVSIFVEFWFFAYSLGCYFMDAWVLIQVPVGKWNLLLLVFFSRI